MSARESMVVTASATGCVPCVLQSAALAPRGNSVGERKKKEEKKEGEGGKRPHPRRSNRFQPTAPARVARSNFPPRLPRNYNVSTPFRPSSNELD